MITYSMAEELKKKKKFKHFSVNIHHSLNETLSKIHINYERLEN